MTVAITNWNGRQYLADCLDAALALKPHVAEVLLVDNASTDDSVAFVTANYPEVRILELSENDGPSPARNLGLSAARTELVLSIDNDAIWATDCLEELLPHLKGDVACVQPRAIFDADPSLIHYDGADMHYVGIMTLRNFYGKVDAATDEVTELGAAISVALLLDREKCLEVGGYDARHFILFEDHDFSYRLRMRGYRILHAPKALLLHREGTAGISFRREGGYTPRRVFLHSRNRWIVLLKCAQWSTLILGAPGILLYEMAYLFFATKNRSLGAWLRGKLALFGMLPGLLKERRQIQKTRRIKDRRLLGAAALTVSPLIERGARIERIQSILDRCLAALWVGQKNPLDPSRGDDEIKTQ